MAQLALLYSMSPLRTASLQQGRSSSTAGGSRRVGAGVRATLYAHAQTKTRATWATAHAMAFACNESSPSTCDRNARAFAERKNSTRKQQRRTSALSTVWISRWWSRMRSSAEPIDIAKDGVSDSRHTPVRTCWDQPRPTSKLLCFELMWGLHQRSQQPTQSTDRQTDGIINPVLRFTAP